MALDPGSSGNDVSAAKMMSDASASIAIMQVAGEASRMTMIASTVEQQKTQCCQAQTQAMQGAASAVGNCGGTLGRSIGQCGKA